MENQNFYVLINAVISTKLLKIMYYLIIVLPKLYSLNLYQTYAHF